LPDEVRLAAAFLLAAGIACALTPVAIRVALRTGWLDRPVGYKAHVSPTAYLGGAAVMVGFLVAAGLTTTDPDLFVPLAAAAVGLAVLGAIDDKVTVRPRWRLIAEVAAATLLWGLGVGWEFLSSGFEQLLLTIIWVVAFTNAFNLMDNMDGAGATVGAVCSAGIAALAVSESAIGLAAVALAVCGACLGFLPFNLRARGPARIFLGDGGSMPLGFILAALAMNISVEGHLGWPVLLVAGMLLGVLVLDTVLVIVSRTRRGISLATGGRDHLTHRLRTRLGSARAVALTIAVAQAGVATLAVAVLHMGRTEIIVAALGCLAFGAAAIARLESPGWTPVFPEWADASAPHDAAAEVLLVVRD
jgi:UDP-GlcNAc:undecaprenyl-phosphate/decaprenyl-phosphate GlcNAc-1-phosphate transferase